MKLTKIAPQKRKKKRFSIWIDGQYTFSCDREILSDLGLEEGLEFSSSELEDLRKKVAEREARQYGIRALARRPMTEASLRRKLAERGCEPDVISSTVESLRNLGLVDDLNYAKLWIRSRVKTNPKGQYVLRKELRMKGVASPLIDRALRELEGFFDERSLLESVAERRARHLAGLDPATRKRRLYDYLIRRGFRRDEVREIIEKH